jgi:hypothetical protein
MTDLVVPADLPGSFHPTQGDAPVVAPADAPAAVTITPGNQTSEYRLARAVCTFLSAGLALFVALSASGVLHPTSEISTAVPVVVSAVIGWVTTNYANSRTDLKTAASAAPSPTGP